jgi:predicted PurR-regulated permease PerM
LRGLERATFLFLLIATSLAFGLVLWQFYGAILWGIAAAVVFGPLNRRLLRSMPGRRNLAALITLLIIIAVVVLPATLITISLVQEVTGIYTKIQSGQINLTDWLRQAQDALPTWAQAMLERFGLGNLDGIREQISNGLANSAQEIAGRALNITQSTLGFLVGLGVMLYLSFFLLRDGVMLSKTIGAAVPLPAGTRQLLFEKFLTVIRATIKGSMVVAIVQGAIGGLVFWGLGIHAPLLWGVVMAFLSLLPAVGSAFVWLPVSLYLLATGAIWQGVVLILAGVFVIGLIDNLMRPMLVGKDVKMPDYIVLLATLGGIEVFGFNGIMLGPMIAAMFFAVWHILTVSRRMAKQTQAGGPLAD